MGEMMGIVYFGGANGNGEVRVTKGIAVSPCSVKPLPWKASRLVICLLLVIVIRHLVYEQVNLLLSKDLKFLVYPFEASG